LLALVLKLGLTYSVRADDSLPFWNETTTKKAIIDFVRRVTKKGSRDFVKPEERILPLTMTSALGSFSDALLAEAKQEAGSFISVKDDWKTIFPK